MTPTTMFGRAAFLAAALALSLTAASEAKAACSDPAAPGVDWSGCDKSRANLSDAYLPYADLTNANLAYANLTYADLEHANLTQADLTHAYLSGADLKGADLTYAYLSGANLTNADLSGADLTGAMWMDGRVCAEGSIGVCN